MDKDKTKNAEDLTVEERLGTLFMLQQTDSKIDQIRTLRGDLPLEVQDLEDEIAGLETRVQKYQDEVKVLETSIANKQNEIKNSEALIGKYEGQQMNVRNNREYDSLSKEIEYQALEMQLAEKRIREFIIEVEAKKASIKDSEKVLNERKEDLVHKHEELEKIVEETKEREVELQKKSDGFEVLIEPRLLTAYKRIRNKVKNGLAVVSVERNACGGCHNKIPPQRQLDICQRKKIIVCEHCGRILIDKDINEPVETE